MHPSPLVDTRVREVHRAIDSAVAELRRRQSPDGAWRSVCDQGPATTAQAAIVLAWVGGLEPGEPEAICRWLLARQLADGGWPSGPVAGEAELGATAICYAALTRLGCTDAAVATARRRLDEAGGLLAAGSRVREADAAPWFLALAGVHDGRALPRIPLGWRRSPLVVRWLQSHVHDGIQLLFSQLGAIGRRLSGDWPERPTGRAKADADAVLSLLDEYQNPDGSWGGFVPIHSLALAAAWACGDRKQRVSRGVAWLRSRMVADADGLSFNAYDPDIWVTGISLRVLRLAGIPASDPMITRAAAFLLAGRSFRPLAPGLDRRAGTTRVGAWGFGAANPSLPDTDDTGVAILALHGLDPAHEPSLALGEEWLRGMQNPDGGFPAFTWNVQRRPRGAIPCLPPQRPGERLGLRRIQSMLPHLTDYATEDLTGRVLRALAARGARLGDPTVDAAVGWLRSQQCEHGGWWGRWITPYVAGTADVLGGLHAVGVRDGDPTVDRAILFLLARQHEDGGWGETPEAYVDASLAGAAPSSPALTAWVIPGLLPWLGSGHPAVLRGVDYLLATQLTDGDWPVGNHVHMYIPPDRYYRLPASPLMHPLEALAMWRQA